MTVTELVMLAAGGVAALTLFLAARRWPAAALVGWFVVVGFVPFWMGVSVGSYFQPASLAGIIVVAALASVVQLRIYPVDVVVAFFFIACVAPVAVGGGSRSTVFGAIALWLVAYLIGRLAPGVVRPDRIQAAMTVVFAVAGGLAVIEFVAGWHPYADLGWGNGLQAKWSNIQERGGVARSEWAFGHSIALGATLASIIPLAATAQRLRLALRVTLVALLAAGVLVSVSRVSMVCAGVGVALVLLFGTRLADRAMRTALVVMALLSVAAAAPFVTGILSEAGDEATGSAAYRGRLTDLLSSFAPLGLSPGLQVAPDGTVYFQGFQSIDSQLIFTGLTYGSFALVLGVVLLAAAVLLTLAQRATPATLSVVAQIPVLAVVALITQYAMWFWFLAGLAVATQVAQHAAAGPSPGAVVPRHLNPERSLPHHGPVRARRQLGPGAR
ncbi:hypothetical protein [Desertihabitans aurantiacus]|uniref:hypothetical protein n=1 Tax=Desertihabitans aurantiacus TaxID=2282477 RepID=UPI000DF81DE3|nr:hypothetical protein [Desertihabitans aurantiacus]